jgi:hypothetical protein
MVGSLASSVCASSTPRYLELIAGIMREVERDYVRPVQVDVLAKNALKGMLTRLVALAVPPETTYCSPRCPTPGPPTLGRT